MKNNLKYLITILIFLVIIALNFIYIQIKLPKTGYVELKQLYDKFQLKKELETKLISIQNSSKNFLDSLELNLLALSKQIEHNKTDKLLNAQFQREKDYYLSKKQELLDERTRISTNYDEQIWNQINQYLLEYGENNHYDYIYGIHGNGSIMYSDKKFDLTDKVIAFINSRYQGKN
jgi:outer membrane protein